jgi:hypothetical protein
MLRKYEKIGRMIMYLTIKSRMHYKHAAAVMKGKKILRVIANQYGQHAERTVLEYLKKLTINKRGYINIVVVRSDLQNSKPCKNCIIAMRNAGVRDITYSTGDESQPFITERASFIQNEHISSAERHI